MFYLALCQYKCVLVPYTECIVSVPDECLGAREGEGREGATEGDTLRTVHCRSYNQVVCHLVIRGSG